MFSAKLLAKLCFRAPNGFSNVLPPNTCQCLQWENCGNYLLMSQAWSLLEIVSHKACKSSCAKGWGAEIVLRLAGLGYKILDCFVVSTSCVPVPKLTGGGTQYHYFTVCS